MQNLRGRIQFRFSVVAAILLGVLVISLVTVGLIVVISDRASRSVAEDLFSASGELARERTMATFRHARDLAATGSTVPAMGAPILGDGRDHPVVPFFWNVLSRSEILYSIFVGRENGDFLQAIRVDPAGNGARLQSAPSETRWILRAVSRTRDHREDGVSTAVEYWTFFDASRVELETRRIDDPDYDPRERPWFVRAEETPVLTDPYVFVSTGERGITASNRLSDRSGVVGVDLTLSALQRFVEQQSVSHGGGMAIVDDRGEVLAGSSRLDDLALVDRATEEMGVISDRRGESRWFVRRDHWVAEDGPTWAVVIAAPLSDFTGPFAALRLRIVVTSLLLVALAIPLILIVAKRLTRVLGALADDAGRIAAMDFSGSAVPSSMIREFAQLTDSFRHMKSILARQTTNLKSSMDQLERIVGLSIAISAESNIDRLSELILDGARELSGADAGSLYLKSEDDRSLEFQIVHTESLGFLQGGTSPNRVTLPPVPLYEPEGAPNYNNVVTYAFHSGRTINIADAYDTTEFDLSGTRRFDEASGYRSQSFLTVPLRPRGSGVIGAMQLINARDPETGEITTFSPEIQRFVEALSSGAATALYNRDLIETQKRLFESMIQLIAGAIDAKSPYTGGHCNRVPVIAEMLADTVERTDVGPFADFQFQDADERRAFRIGAWLHDAGKVTTPDYVVDKAVKLETIYNRIHEVRTRFEVLLRDARIERHQAVLAGTDPASADAELAHREEELRRDFAFVAECNLGGEVMGEERIQRLEQIASRRWYRHFDNTLGLSWDEVERHRQAYARHPEDPAAALPVEEYLLVDRPEQIIPRPEAFENTYGGYDFAIPVPEALYNRGEVHNLKVGRGTLTAEERFKINEHVMQTIAMLDRLPFPRELSRVGEFAGTHHEALNGTGYPRQLTAEALSIPARIMAIADIFEALTASDRPYKRANTLSGAIGILAKFKQDGHIDPDLFDLFLTSGVYRTYAERYLQPDQLDEVKIEDYLG